jgi:hypothetical protein
MNLGKEKRLDEYQTFHREMAASWEAMGEGGPTLAALAALCARRLAQSLEVMPVVSADTLSPEALAILYKARQRGIIEVRGVKTAFETPGRLLAIYVEESEHHTVAFRNREHPEVTIRFFEGFCELCRAGLVLHHLHRDFTLSRSGFELAKTVDAKNIQAELASATEFGLHES